MKIELSGKTLKQAGGALGAMGLLSLLFLASWLLWETFAAPVKIVPWSPGTAEKPSPYVCFAAMKGEKTLLALDCLDTSLTARPLAGSVGQ